MKNTTIIIMAICLMSFTLAYYPGETIMFSNEIGMENLVYTIVGNSSPVSQLDVKINSTNITITFPQDMTPDSFDIIFIENQTREIVKVIYRGGGGSSRTKYVDKNITVYVPQYINTTEIKEVEIEVEKVIEKIVKDEYGFRLWHLALLGIICLIFGALVMKNWKKEDSEMTAEEILEGI